MWWHAPVIPATQEADTGELLKLGRQRLQWAETMQLQLGSIEGLYLKKTKAKIQMLQLSVKKYFWKVNWTKNN